MSMSVKVPCAVKSPQNTLTTCNIRATSRSYADVVKTGALGDHTYCDSATRMSMSMKVPCEVKSPQTTLTTSNIRATNRSYADAVKTGALGDHTYCDSATIQHNLQGVTGALLEHDYYDCDSEFPTIGNLQQPKYQNPSTLFDHGLYTYDPIPPPQFKTHEVISPTKDVNIEQSHSDSITLSEVSTCDTGSLKNHEPPSCTAGNLSGASERSKAKLGKQIVLPDLSSLSGRPISINNIPHQMYSVPGDGNCFFHSLSLLIHGDLKSSFLFRNIICNYIAHNWPLWEEKVLGTHHSTITHDMYVRTMVQGSGWATSTEIEAASILFDMKINVWYNQASQYILHNFIPSTECATSIDILLSGSHFTPLKKVPAIENATKKLISPSKYHETLKKSSTKRKRKYAVAREANIRTKKQKTPTVINTIKQVTEEDQNTQPYVDSAEMSDIPTIKQATDTNEDTYTYTAEIYDEQVHGHIFNSVEGNCQNNNYNQYDPSTDSIFKTENTPAKGKCPNNTTASQFDLSTDTYNYDPSSDLLYLRCRKLGINYEFPQKDENPNNTKHRKSRMNYKIRQQLKQINMPENNIPVAPPLHENAHFNTVMDCIRNFELKQMSLTFKFCSVCKERRLDMNLNSDQICKRCKSDKNQIKLFSPENNMDPKKLPTELSGLTIIEQQLICRISPCMNVHMLKHGGIASSGHCVTFPQEVNEPAQIFPRLPNEINLIRVRKIGKNETSKDYSVRRFKVQNALLFLKENNPAYSDIIISQERLNSLPEDGELPNILTVQCNDIASGKNDKGPAPDQVNPGEIEGTTHSSVLLPDPGINISEKVNKIVKDVIGESHGKVSVNKKGTVTLPWPTRNNDPVSEFTTQYFFTLSFPALFPYGTGDFFINRPRTVTSMADWAEHLLWYDDGRFANHPYFKFIAHNMISRKKAIESGSFVANQKLGDEHLTISDLKEKLEHGDDSFAKKILYFGASLRGTPQYWGQRAKELRALIQYQINEKKGLPSFFSTGSCAEYHFKPLRRLLSMYILETTGEVKDLSDISLLFDVLQKNTHIVAQYFDIRTRNYFHDVMSPAFGVTSFWYRQEFAKSRGMVHWHGLCWRDDKEPHALLSKALEEGLSDEDCAKHLSDWASSKFGLTASHPAGKDENGNPRKNLWPPPEGTAPLPPEEKNPLIKLLMDVSSSQESLLEDHILLTNRFNIHRCSDYCLTLKSGRTKKCRMEFGTELSSGKELRETPAIITDKNGSLRLEMARDHPMLVQHSRFHTQGWRANGDVSLILSKSDPDNPSVDEILAVEKYVSGYACKGNQPTGSVVDLFKDIVNSCSDESTGTTPKSMCTKLLMSTVKRDIPAVEASYELSRLPLYRSSHTFQNISLSGLRVLRTDGSELTITKNTPLDRYLQRGDKDQSSFYNFICKNGKVPVLTAFSRASWPLEENYCQNMLILHSPNWRRISDIKPEGTSWVDLMKSFLQSSDCPNFIKADVEKAKQKIEEYSNDNQDDDDLVENCDQPEWMELIHPCKQFEDLADFCYDDGGPEFDWNKHSFQYPPDLGSAWLNDLKENSLNLDDKNLSIPDVDLSKMNSDQKFAFDIVLKCIHNYIENPDEFEPLRMIVSGTAGSGKSFLIKCIVKAIRTIFSSNKAVQVLCPTGSSANIISGVTLHSFLKIPTTKRGQDMKAPEGSTGETLEKNCEGLKVILVDERSLIGSTTLGWMEFMCRCGVQHSHNSATSWGGIPVVVLFGDDVQLPPVLDSPVYNSSGKSPASMHGVLVWQNFSCAVHLQQIVRQAEDQQQLKDVLLALREYKATSLHASWLQNFQWHNLRLQYGEELLQRMSDKGLFVFPTHEEVWSHNKSKLLELNSEHPIAKLVSECRGFHSKSSDSEKAGGLQKTLFLCKSAKVMLSVNLCVPYGLFNGAIGKIVDIIYLNGKRPENSLPDAIMVEFESYKGPAFIQENSKVVPIFPVDRKIDCPCNSCYRKQIPLKLGWATTIHKCQGMTIGHGEPFNYIVINPGAMSFESRNPGALFVALSRAKSAGNNFSDPDFAWHSSVLVNQDRICHVVKTPTVVARTKEIERISVLCSQTKDNYSFLKYDHGFHSFLERALYNQCLEE